MNFLKIFSEHFVLDYYENKTGEKQFYFLTIASKKKEFEVKKSEKFGSFLNIKKNIQRFSGIHLNINSSFVLTKIVPWLSDQNDMINGAFPNVEWDKFYFQIGRFEDKAILSLARKSQVEEVIKAFESNHLKIKSLTLGISSIYEVVPFIGDQSFETFKFKIQITDNEIVELSGQEKFLNGSKIHISDFDLGSYYLPGLSSFLGLIQRKLNLGSSLENRNKELKSNFKKDVIFKGLVFFSLSVLLLTLLVNSFFYANYYEELNYYQSLNNNVKIEKEKWEQLKIEHAEKKALVENFYSTGHSNTTYILNQLIISIPTTIALTELTFQPTRKAIEEEYPIEINEDTILLAGKAERKDTFSEWLHDMEAKQWIDKIEISNYQLGKQDSDIIFEIEIILNE